MRLNWKTEKLGVIADKITKGGTPTTYGFSFQKKGINFIKVENIQDRRIILSSITDFISKEAHDFQLKSQLESGDILFSIAGTIGSTCIVSKDILPANTNQALAIIKGTSDVLLPKFLVFQLEHFVQKIKLKARGGAMNNVSLEDLKNFLVQVAPLAEQHRIVAKIEELFSELDKGVETLKTAQEQLKMYRQAVLKYAFEGKLTNPDVKDGELPQSWNLSTLGGECVFSQGIQVDVNLQSETKKVGQVRFLRIIDFTQGDEPPRYIDNPGEKYFLRSNEIAMVRYGTVGFVCTGKEGVIANNLFKITPSSKVETKYLIHFLKSDLFRSKLDTKGATMQALSFGLIKPIQLPLPEINEQKVIVQEVESRLSVCDKIEESIEQGLQQAEALRQSILKKAFEGKLVPQDPNDEPASLLLERIKAELRGENSLKTIRRKKK